MAATASHVEEVVASEDAAKRPLRAKPASNPPARKSFVPIRPAFRPLLPKPSSKTVPTPPEKPVALNQNNGGGVAGAGKKRKSDPMVTNALPDKTTVTPEALLSSSKRRKSPGANDVAQGVPQIASASTTSSRSPASTASTTPPPGCVSPSVFVDAKLSVPLADLMTVDPRQQQQQPQQKNHLVGSVLTSSLSALAARIAESTSGQATEEDRRLDSSSTLPPVPEAESSSEEMGLKLEMEVERAAASGPPPTAMDLDGLSLGVFTDFTQPVPIPSIVDDAPKIPPYYDPMDLFGPLVDIF